MQGLSEPPLTHAFQSRARRVHRETKPSTLRPTPWDPPSPL